ncbi:MAG: hypothetical protein K2K75_02545 [Muribaculaceae bacterium]|nr:hypothetical protein [Muribaculaceae bacterium]
MRKRHLATLLLCIAVTAVTTLAVWGQTSGTRLKRGNEFPKDTLPKIALAYVEDAAKRPIDPNMYTHLVYAFVEFNDNCNGIVVKHPEKLQSLVDLKKENPDLKILVSVGGYKREGYSEMTRDKKKRKAFIKDLKQLVDSYQLDGIDLDWEFPTTENGGHTATPKDDRNYATFVKELRKAIGKDKWISYYSNNSGLYIDHKSMMPYVSYVHVSGYNLASPKDGESGGHQSPLYPSRKCGKWCVSKCIEKHMDFGVPKEKILVGIPLFERGKAPFPSYIDCRHFDKYNDGLTLQWDEEAQAPYYADKNGDLVAGFDDERSIEAKFDFIRANGFPGVFVWHHDADYSDFRLGKTIKRLRK